MTDRPNPKSDPAVLRSLLREAGCQEDLADRLGESLDWPVDCEADAWAPNVLRTASPLLQERSQRVWRRQMSSILVAAFMTLPIWLLAGAYGVSMAHEWLCGVVPQALATYLVATYVIVGMGIVGATYATIPLVIGRSRDRMAFAQTWEVAR